MLTKEQIDYLFDFCQAKGVRYYDVQVELVDHLANAIERELSEHPHWSFNHSLDVVFASFGCGDFTPLVREKRKAAKIHWRRLWWSVFTQQLTWPASWVVLGLYLFPGYGSSPTTIFAGFIVFLLCGLILLLLLLIREGRITGRVQAQTLNRFLLTTTSDSMLTYSNTVIILLNFTTGILHSRLYLLVIGTLNYACFLACVAEYRTTLRLKKQVKKDYPDMFNVA